MAIVSYWLERVWQTTMENTDWVVEVDMAEAAAERYKSHDSDHAEEVCLSLHKWQPDDICRAGRHWF